MPVKFDDYEAGSDEIDWAMEPESNAYTILEFLAANPETGFSPKEIHEATGIPHGSVGTTLGRLEDRGLVRHKEPYWAVDPDGIEAYEAVLVGLQAVEESATYDWGGADPEEYRIGLDAVREGTDERD